MDQAVQVGTNTNVKAEPFYFDCPTLQAKILSTTCDKGRLEKSKTPGSSTRNCYKCKDYQCHQQNNPIPAAEYHAGVLSSMDLSKTSGNAVRLTWRNVGKN